MPISRPPPTQAQREKDLTQAHEAMMGRVAGARQDQADRIKRIKDHRTKRDKQFEDTELVRKEHREAARREKEMSVGFRHDDVSRLARIRVPAQDP